MAIVISYFMVGLYISVLGMILFFGPFQKDREEGKFASSKITILVIVISLLISTCITIGRFLQALEYLQTPPSNWIEDPPPFLFELYFMLTFMPLAITTVLFSVVYIHQKRALGITRAHLHQTLLLLLLIESMLFFVGAVFVTNLHPTWMQVSPIVLAFFIFGTAISYIMTRANGLTTEIADDAYIS